MSNDTLSFEHRFDASPAQVWKAISDPSEMRQWYFDLPGFRAEVGYAFTFIGGPPDGIQYVHRCVVTEAIPSQLLAYTWRYEGYEGESLVRWTLTPDGEGTLLRLTHKGTETFPKENPDLAASNFNAGWTAILHTSLRNYLQPKASA